MMIQHRNWPTVPLSSDPVVFSHGLSVFFPAFNDAPSLPSLVARTVETLRRVAVDYEIIVVNDGSRDNTAEVLEQLREKYRPILRVVTHARNQGYGAALRSGLTAATKEFIFYTDGDGQYDPAELELLLAKVTPRTGLVNGYKAERNDPWHRIAIGRLYNWFARRLFRIRLRDIDCDFRLIRKSVLDPSRLRSTGGTICVEMVKCLELSGSEVAEIPVHHYPRAYGRSQFFRLQSLASTFFQLCALFLRQVARPALAGAMNRASGRLPDSFTIRTAAALLASVTVLSLLAGRLPFLSGDYSHIQLGRDYGPVSAWPALFGDVLYRWRATSIILTHWTERVFGLDPLAFSASSLALRIMNAFLVFGLGAWRPVGWRASALAACFFAAIQGFGETVAWHAEAPELLAFCFSIASFLCWIQWLQARRGIAAYGGALWFYALALLSNESAVALGPLCALAAWNYDGAGARKWWGSAPFVLGAGGYFALALFDRSGHFHSSGGALPWIWGLAPLAVLAVIRAGPRRGLLWISGAWVLIALLPYAFLDYMTGLSGRHAYFASAGAAMIAAAAALRFAEWCAMRDRPETARFSDGVAYE
jgi:hypothetical protein